MKTFRKTYKIRATTEEVYIALTNPFTIELWTGFPAKFNAEVGSEFELWDGDIAGKNLELEQNEKIVQEWYFGDQKEQSIVTIKLKQKNNYTISSLEHTNIPDDAYDEIQTGWNEDYWGTLIKYFK